MNKIIIGILVILGIVVFLSRQPNSLVFNLSPIKQIQEAFLPEASTIEQQLASLSKDKLNDLTCGTVGFEGGSDSQGYYKPGGHYIIFKNSNVLRSLDASETAKMDKALLEVLPEHPPKFNPNTEICWTNDTNILTIDNGGKFNGASVIILVFDKQYNVKNKIPIKVEGTKYNGPQILAFTKDNDFYLKITTRDVYSYLKTDNIWKVNFSSNSSQVVGKTILQQEVKQVKQTQQSSGISFDPPPNDNGGGVKGFKRAERLALNGSFTKEIFEIPEDELIAGRCVPYIYNPQEKIFKSTDNTHPRYGGTAGQSLDGTTSEKALNAILQMRVDDTSHIGEMFYCDLDVNNKILISLPSQNQSSNNIFVGLLGNSLDLVGKVELKIPEAGNGAGIEPIAYRKDKIFYLKAQGDLYGGRVNLFKINFVNNSYQTLYQGN